MSTSKIIGINLGTSFSSAAIYKNGKVEIVKIDNEDSRIPSVVAFSNNKILIGREAEEQAAENAGNTISNVKGLIGRRFKDLDPSVLEDQVIELDSRLAFEVTHENKRSAFLPEEITAFILRKLKTAAEKLLGQNVEGAVITVPASFSNNQRQATKNAAYIAGFDTIRLLNSPTAAAIAYASRKKLKYLRRLFILDIEGGYVDASVILISNGSEIRVVSTNGDAHSNIMDYETKLSEHFSKLTLKDSQPSTNNSKLQNQFNNSEQIEFESLCNDIIERISKTFNILFSNPICGSAKDITDVILIGGTTQIPRIEKRIRELFSTSMKVNVVYFDEEIVRGAAILAAKLDELQDGFVEKLELKDIIPMEITLEYSSTKKPHAIYKNSVVPMNEGITIYVRKSEAIISIYEIVNANKKLTLGVYKIVGCPSSERSENISLAYKVDESGILEISASSAGSKIGIEIEPEVLSDSKLSILKQEMEHCTPAIKNKAAKITITDPSTQKPDAIFQTDDSKTKKDNTVKTQSAANLAEKHENAGKTTKPTTEGRRNQESSESSVTVMVVLNQNYSESDEKHENTNDSSIKKGEPSQESSVSSLELKSVEEAQQRIKNILKAIENSNNNENNRTPSMINRELETQPKPKQLNERTKTTGRHSSRSYTVNQDSSVNTENSGPDETASKLQDGSKTTTTGQKTTENKKSDVPNEKAPQPSEMNSDTRNQMKADNIDVIPKNRSSKNHTEKQDFPVNTDELNLDVTDSIPNHTENPINVQKKTEIVDPEHVTQKRRNEKIASNEEDKGSKKPKTDDQPKTKTNGETTTSTSEHKPTNHSSNKSIPIGISLGTKYCCLGVYKNGKFDLIPNNGDRSTPSVVAFDEKKLIVGAFALNQGSHNLKNTIFNVKRFIGKSINDQKVKSDLDYIQFQVKNNSSSRLCFGVTVEGRKDITPEEICGIILRNQKNIAEKFLNCEVNDVVVTVPSLFDNSQREATKDAAIIAGFNNIRLINESTAVALAHGIENIRTKDRRTVMIFNLGGGSFDVSVVTISNKSEIEVHSTSGDPHFGGEDFDQRLFSHFASEFNKNNMTDMSEDFRARRKLRTACEKVKSTLTHSTEARIEIDSLFDEIDFESKITRKKFEEICVDLFEKIKNIVEDALKNAKRAAADMKDVLIVGGTTYIPKVVEVLKSIFVEKQLKFNINREEAAVYGAAIRAANSENVKINDVIGISIEIGIENELLKTKLLQRNTNIEDARRTIHWKKPDKIEIFETEGDSRNLLGTCCLQPGNSSEIGIDDNGILSGCAPTLVEVETSKLNSKEIENMRKKMNQIFEDNKNYHKRQELINTLEEDVLAIEKFNNTIGKRLPIEKLEKIVTVCSEAREWMKSSTILIDTNEYQRLKKKCEKIKCFYLQNLDVV